MPKGYANLQVGEIDPETGCCHPAQSKRTKCACGQTLSLPSKVRRCKCGRLHVKRSGPAFASTGAQSVRPGGAKGCPGVDFNPSAYVPPPEPVSQCEPDIRTHVFSGDAARCACGELSRPVPTTPTPPESSQ